MQEKLKNFLNKDWVKKAAIVLFCLIWIGSLTLKSLYVQFTIKVNKAPVFTMDNFTMGLSLVFTITIICGLILVLSGRKYRFALILVNILLTVILLADILYGRYYYNPITVPILKQIAFLDDVKESTASLFKLKDLLMFLDFTVLIALAFYLKGEKTRKPFYQQVIIGFSIIMIGIIGFQIKYNFVDTTKFAYERKYIGRDLGIFYYHYYDVKTALSKAALANKALTSEEEALLKAVNKAGLSTDNIYTNIGEGKNLIMIQLEAFQNFMVGLEVDGQEVTPFLNQLRSESLYLPNFFFETAGGNTVDAELLTNTSMLPTYGGSAYYEYPNNTYISLPKKLKEKGYAVFSFHGYEASFWNREVMHKTLGFDRFYSLDDFEMTEKVGWAISDKAFFRQSLDRTMKDNKGLPFYSFMVALSSHHPYDAFYSGPFTQKEEEKQQLFRRYLNAGHYVDSALKDFFDYLKETGVYDNTVVVIYGDHAGLFNEDTKTTCEFLGLNYSNYQWQKLETVPLFIHIPNLEEPKTIEKVAGQSDLLPTLANIMNFELEYTMSQDILDPNYKGNVVKRNNNVVTNDFVYIAQEDTLYDFETGQVIERAQHEGTLQENFDQLIAQDLIYKSNYLRLLNNKE